MNKKITFIVGHYGSGKSETAINLALFYKVDMIIDLDIVNPYFRSREVKELFNNQGIKLISSPLKEADTADLPYLSSDIYLPFHQNVTAIYDVGGDKIGSRVIKQFQAYYEEDFDVLLVINIYRLETDSKIKIIKMIEEIESETKLKITGLINNSNCLKETTLEDIKLGQSIILDVSKQLKIPIVYTIINERLFAKNLEFAGKIIPLKLYLRKDWL